MSALRMSLAVLAAFAWLAECEREAPRPNVVLMLADDVGFGDLGCYGHPTSTSPNLDQMASEGLRFTQFYSASPVCSPSSCYSDWSFNIRPAVGFGLGCLCPQILESTPGLPLNETTIAAMLKTAGYSTAMVGKWHLGVGENLTYLPTNQGFDSYLGIPYAQDECPCTTCFYPNVSCFDDCIPQFLFVPCPLFENDKIVQQPTDLLTLTDKYVNAATTFIKTSAAQKSPFFLYFSFQHTHHPQFAGEKFTNSSIRLRFGDALNELDWAVGEVFAALKDAGVDKDTFVFFTSDNGPSLTRDVRGGNAGLLRCGKGTTWEGGQRVPAVAWWPGMIRPGKTFELAATLDLLPTIDNLAGAELPSVTLDGFDLSPLLFDNKPSSRDVFYHYPDTPDPSTGVYAVRWKQYKAHYYAKGGLCPHTHPDMVCRGNYTLHHYDPPLLYDLNSDPSEIYNLTVSQYADVMAQIEKLKEDFDSSMVWGQSQPSRGSSNAAQPCAKPGCSPFPMCCTTSTDDLIDPPVTVTAKSHP